jgi:hypothetical protein
MTQQTLPPHLVVKAHGAESAKKPYRTPGEKVFGVLKYGVVGFLANVSLAYFIGRDMRTKLQTGRACPQ